MTDPRNQKNQCYSLESLLLIVFASTISGYDSLEGMVEYAQLKLDWLNQFVELKRAPCAETLRYFLACLSADELVQGFQAFVQSAPTNDVIAIDGKTMRGTARNGCDALHVLSAWSAEQGISLGALASTGKSNEIKTIPKLLDAINIQGATVTLDAMGCQRSIAAKIRERQGDYVLQLKANQKHLLSEIQAYHHKLEREGYTHTELGQHDEIDKGHGRLEIRRTTQFKLSDWVSKVGAWQDVASVIRIERERQIRGEVSTEVSWYLSSLAIDAEHAARAVRQHWEVENKLHWRLDVIFKEDESQQSSFALTVATLKRFCMNLLTLNDQSKRRMKHRVMAAAIDDDYREKVLFG